MRHSRDTNEFLEVPGDELRPVVGDDPWTRLPVFLPGSLENDLDIGLFHLLAQIPVDNRAAEPVQHAAQIVKRPAEIDVAHVDMPMLVRLRRLLELERSRFSSICFWRSAIFCSAVPIASVPAIKRRGGGLWPAMVRSACAS